MIDEFGVFAGPSSGPFSDHCRASGPRLGCGSGRPLRRQHGASARFVTDPPPAFGGSRGRICVCSRLRGLSNRQELRRRGCHPRHLRHTGLDRLTGSRRPPRECMAHVEDPHDPPGRDAGPKSAMYRPQVQVQSAAVPILRPPNAGRGVKGKKRPAFGPLGVGRFTLSWLGSPARSPQAAVPACARRRGPDHCLAMPPPGRALNSDPCEPSPSALKKP